MLDRIVICGIPCSGTKLLNHMIHTALPDWDYSPKERRWAIDWGKPNIITKRPIDIFKYSSIILHSNVGLIVTVRDPFLVLTSKHRMDNYWVYSDRIGKKQPAPIKWYRKILRARMDGGCVVSYEDLVRNPEMVQEQIGRSIRIKWQDTFANYIHTPLPEGYTDLDVIKPLHARQLNAQDLVHLGTEIEKCPELIKIRGKLGYESVDIL